jgi:hypothetical protein
MCELNAEQQAQLDQPLDSAPGLASGLRPLLAGEFGLEARDLLLRFLSVQAAPGTSMRAAFVPALADAIRIAPGEHDDA